MLAKYLNLKNQVPQHPISQRLFLQLQIDNCIYRKTLVVSYKLKSTLIFLIYLMEMTTLGKDQFCEIRPMLGFSSMHLLIVEPL